MTMKILHANLPRLVGDDRIEHFFRNLSGKTGRFTDAQAQFLRTGGDSIPDMDASGAVTREKLPYETFLVLVYETNLVAEITELVRAAISEVWPDYKGIH